MPTICPTGSSGFTGSPGPRGPGYRRSARRRSGVLALVTAAAVALLGLGTPPALAGTVTLNGCTIVSNPTSTHHTDCPGAALSDANLSGVDLSYANLTRAYLNDSRLTGANLYDADLTGAYLVGAYLMRANLTGANLVGANLTGATVSGTILVPANQTATATTDAGATVSWADPTEPAGVTFDGCDPASGYTFPMGTTTVACTVHADHASNSGGGYFKVTVAVPDTDLAISTPADISTDATGPTGARVTYPMPTVTDEDSPLPLPSCSPASGTVFPIGTTTVRCSATDTDDTPSTVNSSFSVTVRGASAQLAALEQAVQGVGAGTSLADQVASTQADLASHDIADTCGTLGAFVHTVRAQMRHSIDSATAQTLIANAQRIETVLDC